MPKAVDFISRVRYALQDRHVVQHGAHLYDEEKTSLKTSFHKAMEERAALYAAIQREAEPWGIRYLKIQPKKNLDYKTKANII